MRIKWFSVIRLTGLIFVLIYHFFKAQFTGGFIGVDLFFTCSGYLVTSLFIDEYIRTGGIDIKRFLKRRIYRIVPPVVLMVLLVMPLTFLVKRDFVADIGHQLLAVFGFTTNIYEQLTGGNYESQFVPHLFLHTWSLAIEVQFYLLWGGVIYLLSRRGLKPNQFRGAIFLVSLACFSLSFLSLFVRAFLTTNFSTLYFSSVLRSSSLFLGSLFATLAGVANPTKRFRRNVQLWSLSRVLQMIFGSLAVLVLLAFVLDFNNILTYLFGFVLSSLFTGFLIYTTRVLHDKLPHLNEPRWISFLADISYGIYLFHWPLYVVLSQFLPQLLAVGVTLVLSLLLATLSFKVVEPILAGHDGKLFGLTISLPEDKRPIYGVLGILTALMLGISVTAPKVGEFETSLLTNGLTQAQAKLNRTHTLLAGDASALGNVFIIGDSVTLSSTQGLSEVMPDAVVDAAVSRSFASAFEAYQLQIANDTLAKVVVLAIGVNSVYNYQEDLEQFITALPEGHRLVIVTPYNIKDGRIPEMRKYELTLPDSYKYVAVADWYQVALDHPEIWVGSDGVHFDQSNAEAGKLYAQTIKDAVTQVAKQPAKGEK